MSMFTNPQNVILGLKNTLDEKNNLTSLYIKAFFIRVIVLILVFLMQDSWGTGFIDSTLRQDDYRYEQGAILYADSAKKIVDRAAFSKAFIEVGTPVGDNTGYGSSNTPLWYWIVSIVVYLTKSPWVMRLFNVIISVFCIKYIYIFTKIFSSEKAALLASKLYAYLPYPVVFSCFLYKDQLLTLCLIVILSNAIRYKCLTEKRLSLFDMMLTIISFIAFSGMRSGLPYLILAFMGAVFLLKKKKNKQSIKEDIIKVLTIIAILLALVISFSYSFPIIVYKLQAYIGGRISSPASNGVISYFAINGVGDLYKFPFTYIFTIFQPLAFNVTISNWFYLLGYLNICMIPIAVGNIIYIFYKKKDIFMYLSALGLYCIVMIISIGIFRQFYFVLPIPLIFFADYWSRNKNRDSRIILYLSSLIILVAIILYFYFMK